MYVKCKIFLYWNCQCCLGITFHIQIFKNFNICFFSCLGEPITLMPDVYKYTFSCQLPEDLPTSLEGTFGSIRYVAIVTINVPIWPDKIFEKPFTVIKPVNLNEMFELKVCKHYYHTNLINYFSTKCKL